MSTTSSGRLARDAWELLRAGVAPADVPAALGPGRAARVVARAPVESCALYAVPLTDG